MANIRDIAKETGYSIATISRVINNHPYVEEGKRQEVLAVMEQLNYVPNSVARSLSFGTSKHIGIIIPFTNHPYYEQLVKGVTEAAFLNNHKVTLLPTNYDKTVEKKYLDEFAAKEFDGLIIASRASDLNTVEKYLKYGKIVLCEDVELDYLSCVFVERQESFDEALCYLKQQGVKRLGLTLGRCKQNSKNSQLAINLCKKVFPDFDEANVVWGCQLAEDGLEIANFFKQQQVDGIFCNGDEVAAGIIEGYESQNVPLVIGQENLFISRVMKFPTIDHHLPECGRKAFEALFKAEIEKICIPYTFIPR